MKLFLSFYLLCLFFLNPLIGFSQTEDQKVFEISGVKYVLHTVKKNETTFSICQKYKVAQTELQKANSGISTVLQAGTTLKIPVGKVAAEPVKVEVKPQTQTPSNEEYYFHKVAKNQTLFSIAKQYGITEKELILYNPELSAGLIVGQVLKIPVRNTTDRDQEINRKTGVSDNQSFTKYKVESGETLYSLSARFGVEASELKKANPALLSRSLQAGETILIPQQAEKSKGNISPSAEVSSIFVEKKVESEPGICQPIAGKNNQKYKVGLLLPLYLPGNEQADAVSMNKAQLMSKISLNTPTVRNSADTTSVVNGMNIDQRAVNFVEFYEGTLLAIDSLQRSGMNIELFVFDVTNQQSINSLLQLDEFRDLNLIVGPVLPDLQENVASFAAKNRIPMVSPLSPAGNLEQNNSYYFKVSPGKEYQIEQTASYIADEFSGKNFILLQIPGESASPEAKLAQMSKEKLMAKASKSFHEYNFQNQGVNTINSILDENGENIFFIPSDNEAQVTIAMTNLNALAEKYNIVLMATPAISKLKSLQTESFHRVRLRYLTPYFADYNKPLVRRIVSEYRDYFSNEPSQFSFQGFDVSFYFLSALYRYGRDFRSCLPDYPMALTQMDFNFRKVAPMGGYMNHSLFVNSYERNFDILNFGVVGK